MYDTDKDGQINYTEFAAMLFEHYEAPTLKKSEAQSAPYPFSV